MGDKEIYSGEFTSVACYGEQSEHTSLVLALCPFYNLPPRSAISKRLVKTRPELNRTPKKVELQIKILRTEITRPIPYLSIAQHQVSSVQSRQLSMAI